MTTEEMFSFFKLIFIVFFHYHLVPLCPHPNNHHTPWVLFRFCSIPPPPATSHHLLSIWVHLCFACYSVCSLDSTYEWNHTEFVLLWFTSLSIMFSMSIHTVEKGKIFFFFMAEIKQLVLWWTLGLLPYLGDSTWCCNEHRDANVLSN